MFSSGKVAYYTSSVLTPVCEFHAEEFPFDRQTCNLYFAPFGLGGNEINLNIVWGDMTGENAVVRNPNIRLFVSNVK